MIKKPRPKRKQPKVISIKRATANADDTPRLIASDEVTQRMVIAIGHERLAYDLTARVTKLGPTVGDQPAQVVPLKRKGE